jgi:hypothetical protein
MVLYGGMDAKTLSLTAKDAQLLESRKFQVEDIARAFGVPPWMLGSMEKTTSWGSGVEQMGIGFLIYTLSRTSTDSSRRSTGSASESAKYFCEFNVDGLLQADAKGARRLTARRSAAARARLDAHQRDPEAREPAADRRRRQSYGRRTNASGESQHHHRTRRNNANDKRPPRLLQLIRDNLERDRAHPRRDQRRRGDGLPLRRDRRLVRHQRAGLRRAARRHHGEDDSPAHQQPGRRRVRGALDGDRDPRPPVEGHRAHRRPRRERRELRRAGRGRGRDDAGRDAHDP